MVVNKNNNCKDNIKGEMEKEKAREIEFFLTLH